MASPPLYPWLLFSTFSGRPEVSCFDHRPGFVVHSVHSVHSVHVSTVPHFSLQLYTPYAVVHVAVVPVLYRSLLYVLWVILYVPYVLVVCMRTTYILCSGIGVGNYSRPTASTHRPLARPLGHSTTSSNCPRDPDHLTHLHDAPWLRQPTHASSPSPGTTRTTRTSKAWLSSSVTLPANGLSGDSQILIAPLASYGTANDTPQRPWTPSLTLFHP